MSIQTYLSKKTKELVLLGSLAMNSIGVSGCATNPQHLSIYETPSASVFADGSAESKPFQHVHRKNEDSIDVFAETQKETFSDTFQNEVQKEMKRNSQSFKYVQEELNLLVCNQSPELRHFLGISDFEEHKAQQNLRGYVGKVYGESMVESGRNTDTGRKVENKIDKYLTIPKIQIGKKKIKEYNESPTLREQERLNERFEEGRTNWKLFQNSPVHITVRGNVSPTVRRENEKLKTGAVFSGEIRADIPTPYLSRDATLSTRGDSEGLIGLDLTQRITENTFVQGNTSVLTTYPVGIIGLSLIREGHIGTINTKSSISLGYTLFDDPSLYNINSESLMLHIMGRF